MVHKDIIEKRKAKQGKKGNVAEQAPLPPRRKRRVDRPTIATPPAIDESSMIKVASAPSGSVVLVEESTDPKSCHEFALIEKLEFTRGNNILSIEYCAKNNRQRCIKVSLNGQHEIRPVTYNGTGTGQAFWELLKGALRK